MPMRPELGLLVGALHGFGEASRKKEQEKRAAEQAEKVFGLKEGTLQGLDRRLWGPTVQSEREAAVLKRQKTMHAGKVAQLEHMKETFEAEPTPKQREYQQHIMGLLTRAAIGGPGALNGVNIPQEPAEEVETPAQKLRATIQQRRLELAEEAATRAGKPAEMTPYQQFQADLALREEARETAATVGKPIRGLSGETGGRLAGVQQALDMVKQVSAAVVDPRTGEIDKTLVFTMSTTKSGLPYSTGRMIRQKLNQALEAKLRIDTGAAATEVEFDRLLRTFLPRVTDSDETIKNKLDSLIEFFERANFILDPTGKFAKISVGGQTVTIKTTEPSAQDEDAELEQLLNEVLAE